MGINNEIVIVFSFCSVLILAYNSHVSTFQLVSDKLFAVWLQSGYHGQQLSALLLNCLAPRSGSIVIDSWGLVVLKMYSNCCPQLSWVLFSPSLSLRGGLLSMSLIHDSDKPIRERYSGHETLTTTIAWQCHRSLIVSQIDGALNRGKCLETDLLLALTTAHELEGLSEWRIRYDQDVGRDNRGNVHNPLAEHLRGVVC